MADDVARIAYTEPVKKIGALLKLKKDHELSVQGRAVYYTYSFDLGQQLDVAKLADKLLRYNLASTANTPDSEDVRVSKYIVDVEQTLRSVVEFNKFNEALASRDTTWRSLAKISIRLTLTFMFWKIMGHLRSTDSPKPSQQNLTSTIQSLDSTERTLRKTLVDRHTWGSLRTLIERQQYDPRYYDWTPFIRVEMLPIPFTNSTVGTDVIQVSLKVHRSGVCMLTLASAVQATLDKTGMNDCMISERHELITIDVPEPVYKRYGRANGVKNTGADFDALPLREGVRWLRLKSGIPSPISFHSVFEIYHDAIISLAGNKGPSNWSSYTTLSIGAPTCACVGSEAKERHRSEFALIALRATRPVSLRAETEAELIDNVLKVSDRDLWVSAGNALYANWNATGVDYTEDLMQLIPIESAVHQLRQLQKIDRTSSNSVIRDARLFESQESLAVGLQEYRRNLLHGPDDENITNAVLSENSADILYDQLLDRVKILESIVSTRFSRIQSRRSIAIASSGFFVVIAFLLPRINETIRTFEKQGKWPLELTSSAIEAFGGRGALVLALYFGALTLAAGLILAFSIRKRPKIRKRTQFGYKVKNKIGIRLEQQV
ncbi:hypothetical protein [Rhodococcus sp. 05-2254-6]|uniref:hypothetical protein n=1 Tax=Rhodococcus sp. 05-2254-6 TaxID=2022489 RepID=UPI00117AFE46|nr:hypothetical protein [Rhodococcus sp. 05-2254-6]